MAHSQNGLRQAESLEIEGPPWARIEAALMSTSRMIRRAYDVRLSEIGLNQTGAMVLSYIDERGPMSQTRLAEAMGINRASAGDVVDTLAERGYLERGGDPNDKRVWLVRITEEGREAGAAVAAVDQALRQQLRAGISRADRKQLAGVLEQLQRNLTGHARPTQSGMPT